MGSFVTDLDYFSAMVTELAKDSRSARILVCGGREYIDKEKVFRTLGAVVSISEENQLGHMVTIIHGACGMDEARMNYKDMKGADFLADQWAICNWKPIIIYPANWTRWGRNAGAIRNEKMLVEGKPDFVVAFPGGPGTRHMKTIANAVGVRVLEIA